MITITIFKNSDSYTGFDCMGHAGYAPEGDDVVCAGVSALVINTVNSISKFSGTKFRTTSDEKTGKLAVTFREQPDSNANLLMQSLVLGLQGIQDNYGNKYIHLNFKEV